MEKINFEDGVLVTPAKVIIEGKEYEIIPATRQGNTPLSSYNLKRMQDNIESAVNENAEEIEKLNEKNILTVGLAEDLEFTSTIDYQVFEIPLTKEIFRVGELLRVSDGKIVIPAGVTKILVSAQCVSNGGQCTYGMSIRKNNVELYRSYTVPTNQTFNLLSISRGGIDVSEGDIISLTYYINNTGYTRKAFGSNGYRTYLTVEVIR